MSFAFQLRILYVIVNAVSPVDEKLMLDSSPEVVLDGEHIHVATCIAHHKVGVVLAKEHLENSIFM